MAKTISRICIILLLFSGQISLAQTTEATILANKNSKKDSAIYTNFKLKMYKHKLTKEFYDLLFRDIYNSNQKGAAVSKIIENPFLVFDNQKINSIRIKVLDVNGYSVFDTLRTPKNWSEKTLNKLHKSTQQETILKQFLLFKEGDKLNATLFSDNERLLRTNRVFRDARILVTPSSDYPNEVDVLVIVQDVWSLNPYISYSSPKNFILGLDQINFKGQANYLSTRIGYQDVIPGYQKLGAWVKYSIPSIIPKSYLRFDATFESSYQNQTAGLKLSRAFIRPETKWAGSGEVSFNRPLYQLYNQSDSLYRFYLSNVLSDFWLGRSFKPAFLRSNSKSRFNVSVRKRTINYLNNNTNTALFQNINQTLFSFGYSNRKYERDVLIYGFGRTEDVPVGYLASVVWGIDKAGLGFRKFEAINFSQGHYLKNIGYLNTNLNIGAFVKNGNNIEAGNINFALSYFSALKKPSKKKDWYWRQFINLYYTKGINRYALEYIYLNDVDRGFSGVSNTFLRGTERFVLNMEGVFFSPISILGFRMANFMFCDLGKISFQEKSFVKSPLYYGFGTGARFRNESLTFSDFQFRLGYYPSVPGQKSSIIFSVGTIIPLRIKDFNIEAPNLIPFH